MNNKKGFTLSIDKTGKDQGKANYANAFIGFGVSNRRSSTGIYLQDALNAGLPVNYEITPDSETVAFVSVASEGIHNEKTVELAKKVIAGGGTVIMDASGTGFGKSHSRHNINGEGKVQDALGKPSGQTIEGYNFWGNLDNNVYRKNGFSSRDEYLSNLAEDYGISKFEVCSIAEILGENEDFDGLISTLEDYSMMCCY